jgi:hypothetical protein
LISCHTSKNRLFNGKATKIKRNYCLSFEQLHIKLNQL